MEEDVKIGYKVVRPRNSKSYRPASHWAVQSFVYQIGKNTKRNPKNHGPIAVFKSLEGARLFLNSMNNNPRFVILKVKYKKSQNENFLWRKPHGRFYPSTWRRILVHERVVWEYLGDLPEDTILTEWVTPIEEVKKCQ